MSDPSVDQIARDSASSALAEIKAHQRVCEELGRQAQEERVAMRESFSELRSEIRGNQDDFKRAMETFNNRLWQFGYATMGVLVCALGALIMKAFVFH